MTPADVQPAAPVDVDGPFAAGLKAQEAGRLTEAARHFEQILATAPDHPRALHRLGLVRHAQGDSAGAVTLLRRAIEANPAVPRFRFNLCTILDEAGQPEAAREALVAAAAELPGSVQSWMETAAAQLARNLPVPAAYHARLVLLRAPDHQEARLLLGRAQLRLGLLQEAVASFDQLLAQAPDHVGAQCKRAHALLAMGASADAVAAFQRILDAWPDTAEAVLGLGMVARKERRLDDAIGYLRHAHALRPQDVQAHGGLAACLLERGRWDEAQVLYEQLLQTRPADLAILVDLATIAMEKRDVTRAERLLAQARQIAPQDLSLLKAQARLAMRRGQYAAAARMLVEPAARQAHDTVLQMQLAEAIIQQGRAAEGVAVLRRAVAANPRDGDLHSDLMFNLQYLDWDSPMALADAHREWAGRHAAHLQAHQDHHVTREPERRLRLGIVSPNLRAHPSATYLAGLMRRHDPDQLQIVCFSEVLRTDFLTREFQQHADGWHEVSNLDDESLCRLIREERIDVLLEDVGHQDHNRLTLFARRPAPIQVAYMGYMVTRGLPQIDWWLTDRLLNPPASQAQFVERLWHLDRPYINYTPPRMQLPVAPLPAAAQGYVTFGSANRAAKISPRTIAAWAKVLAAVPGSHLYLKAAAFADEEAQAWFTKRFVDAGVAAERLAFAPDSNKRGYLQAFNEIDIHLDTFPYNGTTTTLDALWMGVPTVGIWGDAALSRSTAAIAEHLGHADWVGVDEAGFVAAAAALAGDIPALARLRAGLRQELEASPIGDGADFARAITAALREMWRRWCAHASAATDAQPG